MKLLPRDSKSDSDSDDAILEAKCARTRPIFAAKFVAAQSSRHAKDDAAANIDDEELDAEIDAVLKQVDSSSITSCDAKLVPSASAASVAFPACLADADDLRRPTLPSHYVGYECNVCNMPITCGHRYKCVGGCVDFDVCGACHECGPTHCAVEGHEIDHPMSLKIFCPAKQLLLD